MNIATKNFIENLKQDSNVLGIILFGSWARGNNRPKSDVDLVVIQKNGYKRSVETYEGQIFEIIYIQEDAALEFWESHKNDAAGLWEVAQILFDKEGVVERIREKVQIFLKEGKPKIDHSRLEQLRFDAEDQVNYAKYILKTDEASASLILHNKVFALTELYFDIQCEWTPAPKRRLEKIKEMDRVLYDVLVEFYSDTIKTNVKINLAQKIIDIVFQSN